MNGRYFNAGVIYVNLKKWHEANLTPYLLTLLRGETKYGSLKYLDQDALNIAFNMNNIYLAKDFDTIYTLKNELYDRSHRKYQQTITDKTVLIHYTGITKPWHSWLDIRLHHTLISRVNNLPGRNILLKRRGLLQKCRNNISICLPMVSILKV